MYATHRTPAKRQRGPASPSGNQHKQPEGLPSVSRSIGEWESSKPESQQNPSTPPQTINPNLTVTKPPSKAASTQEARQATAHSPSGTISSPPKQSVPLSKVAEARACLNRAKLHLGNSRNIKTEIKTEVTAAIDRLYQLVKESEMANGGAMQAKPAERKKGNAKDAQGSEQITKLCRKIEENSKLSRENTERMHVLQAAIDSHQKKMAEAVPAPGVTGGRDHEELMAEVQSLRRTTEEMSGRLSEMKENTPSYSEMLSKPRPTPVEGPKHSVIVSSDDIMDTGADVIDRVRQALDAKKCGLQIERVRKIKDQKVVLSCATKVEIEKTVTQLRKDKKLKIEEAKNKNPLVIIRDVQKYITDEDIKAALKTQNMRLLGDLSADDSAVTVKYRRRARNPLQNHVVLQVPPKMWQRLTSVDKIFIDIQYVQVHDQTPLIQCTRCLAYGHGRKTCKESTDLCAHCGGTHLKSDCPKWGSGEPPVCRNCVTAKVPDTAHTAFGLECPTRKKWDALARTAIAYC